MIDLHRPDPGRILVVGHRGAEALAPENTWAAFQAGFEAGADLLELDVQLTADGEAVVIHDFTLWPKLRDRRWVRELTYRALQELDVGSWFSPTFAGQHIPHFAEVLDWARGKVPLLVDLKHGFWGPEDDRLEMTALDLIDNMGMANQVVLSSWDQVALARVRARRPGILLSINQRQRVANPVGRIRPTGARWVTVYWPQTDQDSVARLQRAGLVVNLTDLFSADYAEAQRLGVNAVTVTDPRAARAALAGHRPA